MTVSIARRVSACVSRHPWALLAGVALGCALGCSRASDGPELAPASAPRERARAEAMPTQDRDPGTIPGTVLWLDAARGVERNGEHVTRWVDQSEAGNHAVARSERSAPAFVEVALNGEPALLFDGQGQYLMISDASSLQFGSGDFTLAAVLSHTTHLDTAWGYGCIVSKQEPTGGFVGASLWGNSENRTGQLMGQLVYHEQHVLTAAQDLNDGRPLVVLLQRRTTSSGTRLLLRVNRSEARSTPRAATDVSALGSNLHIGGTPDARQALLGNIAELVAIKGPLSAADTEALEAYLFAKYDL